MLPLAIGSGTNILPIVRMSKATEMCLRDHNSNNCTNSGNVCYCMHMVNNYYDKFRSFSRLYMTLFRHRTSTYYLHGRADRFLVSVSNGQVAALSDWALIESKNVNVHYLIVGS